MGLPSTSPGGWACQGRRCVTEDVDRQSPFRGIGSISLAVETRVVTVERGWYPDPAPMPARAARADDVWLPFQMVEYGYLPGV
jgi:hypothetical protein